MKVIRKLLTVTMLALAGAFVLSYAYAASPTEETYYTKVNIWYEFPEKIFSTNYHKGTMMPVGSKVKIAEKSGNKISFTKEGLAGVTFTITNVRKHSLVSTEELFNLYFSKDDPNVPGGEFSELSSREKENVESGSLTQGMSKEAAIMAYGYPPKHRTPDLANDIWYYWLSRVVMNQVTFKNNKIIKIERMAGSK